MKFIRTRNHRRGYWLPRMLLHRYQLTWGTNPPYKKRWAINIFWLQWRWENV